MKATGLVVCSWHTEYHDSGHGHARGWCFVFRRNTKNQRFRVVYLPTELIMRRQMSHGLCGSCSAAIRIRYGVQEGSFAYT